MDSFIFALNATVPLFLVIALGYFLQRIGFLNKTFNKTANNLVFKVTLPVSMFRSVAGMDLYSRFDARFCLFCFAVTTVMFMGVWACASRLLKDKRQIGAFSQAAVRSSIAVLGIALASNIYGDAGMVPMMIMIGVPFFNIYSVIILSFSPRVDENGQLLPASRGSEAVKRACVNVVKNPLIRSILLGLAVAALRIQLPVMVSNTLTSLSNTVTPVSLLVIGASLCEENSAAGRKTATVSTFVKLFLMPAIFLPVAGALGFRNSAMIAILIMVGAPSTSTCYVMAKNMGGDGALTSNAILLSTVFSSVSITLWLALLRSHGWV